MLSTATTWSTRYRELQSRMHSLSVKKLGFPTSLLSSNPSVVDNTALGIWPDSLAGILLNNVGDPYKPSETYQMEVKQFEVEVLEMLAHHLGIQPTQAAGYVTSGGTEGNLAGLWWCKRYLSNGKARPRAHPTLVCTAGHTHYSIYKIAELLSLDVLDVRPCADGSLDVKDLREVLGRQSRSSRARGFIVCANVGTTVTGAVDDVPAIRRVLDEMRPRARFAIHVDAALIGVVLPILAPFGVVDDYLGGIGAHTLSISGHKYLGISQPCGVVLTTRPFIDAAFSGSRASTTIEYAGRIDDKTITGSRSGLNVLLLHNALHHMQLHETAGLLRETVRHNLERAKYLCERLATIFGRERVSREPHSFNVSFPRPSERLASSYQLMIAGERAVICVLSNVTRDLIDAFVRELAVSAPSAHYPERCVIRGEPHRAA